MSRLLRNVAHSLILLAFAPGLAFAQKAAASCADSGSIAAAPELLMGAGSPTANWSAASPQATVSPTADGSAVTISLRQGAQPYPGATLAPAGGKWDLSNYGQLIAQVTNTGKQPVLAGLRADDGNSGKSGKWNDESLRLKPGESGTLTLVFGRAQGKPAPSVNRSDVERIIVYSEVAGGPVELRLDSLVAAPGSTPASTAASRTRVSNEAILGGGSCHDRSVIAVGFGGGQAELSGPIASRKLNLKTTAAESGALLRPVTGSWDLRDDLQLMVKVRNTGSAAASVSGRAESPGGGTAWSSPVNVPAGGNATLTIAFDQAEPVVLGATPAPKYTSDMTTGIALRVSGAGEHSIVIDEVSAGVPAPAPLPDWIGKRPPVPGNWTMTLNEDFNGNSLDASRWSATGVNYLDKVSHYSKQNVVVSGGKATLHFERRKGHANDDPAQAETEYATGYLSSVGKWTQRYGYFEARVKLPKAPGLWPAVWLMPDRGADAPDRLSTFKGGMEFDFIEHLTRFGPNRYNVALHWDGYAAEHKTAGDDGIYAQPDAEGYVVAGVLWEPNTVVFYANGKEVARRSDARIGNVPDYLLVTLVAGGWGGNDLTGSGLPDDLSIDWIRAWRRADK